MKIPIKKHTKVRRPMSRHITLLMDNTYNIPFDLYPTRKLLIKDIEQDKEIIALKDLKEV